MELSHSERASGELLPETAERAARLVRANGYVVFEGLLPPALVARLRAEFLRVFDAHVSAHDPNRGANRYQMHLPFTAPFSDPAVVSHPAALAVLDRLLGPDYVCHYFASDTALPGSDYQSVHSDVALLFPGEGLSLPPYSVVLNIPLVDFRPDNGPLEVWPGGTHLVPSFADMAALAERMHSEPVLMPAGSLLLRDMRLWHRGTPNRSDAARPNLALIYSRPWLRTDYPPVEIARSDYDALPERARRLFRHEKVIG